MARGIGSNAEEILRRMKARQAAIVRELHVVAVEIGAVCNREAKVLLQKEVYDIPIPLRRKINQRLSDSQRAKLYPTSTQTRGKAPIRKWRRTGDLLRNERFKADGPDVVLYNGQEYAAARNALGGPPEINKAGRRAGIQRDQTKLPAAERSLTRPVQWQHLAIQRHMNWIRKRRRDAVLKALKLA